MLRGLYSAATAMDALEQSHEVTAQNIANATVPGYRRRGITFESMDQNDPSAKADGSGNIRGTHPTGVYTDFEAGSLQETGNPLDLALHGKGFFALQGPNGPLYTRNGVFELGPGGELRNKDGLAVQGTSGGIVIPTTASRIKITDNGSVVADETEVGQLKLADFPDNRVLTPVGATTFAAPAGLQPQTGNDVVQQGYREGSNVQVVNEMVSMIAGMRQYEAAQRLPCSVRRRAKAQSRARRLKADPKTE